MEFKELLTKFRQQHGMPKSELSRKIGLTTGNYIVSLEKGKQEAPRIDLCRKIADALELNENETNLLLLTSSEERVSKKLPDEFSILRGSFVGRSKKPFPNNWVPPDITMRVPLLKREDVNKYITEDDIPIGGETIPVAKSAKESTYALRVITEDMIPEFHPKDIIIIEECTHPKDGDYVLVADNKGKIPLLRQFKDYGKTRILHPLNHGIEDIILEKESRYSVVGKVIERKERSKTY